MPLAAPAVARTAFTVDGVDCRWQDVIAAARARGTWAGVEREVREGIACLRLALAGGREVDPEAVRASATRFRQERRLLAAEEMEAWLGHWDLTVKDWMGYIRAGVARAELVGEVPAPLLGEVGTDEVEPLVWPAAVCSGALGRLAEDLAGRLAVRLARADAGSRPQEGVDAAAYEAFCRAAVTPERLAEQVSAMRLDWTTVEFRAIGFEHQAAAQEAVLMLRDDGVALETVAAAAEAAVVEGRVMIEDADPGRRLFLVGAAPGDVLGPLAAGGHFDVVVVQARLAPSLDDEEVLRRAGDGLIRAAVRTEIDDRVRWRDG